MRKTSLITVAVACAISGLLSGLGLAWAAVGLDTYVDQNGFIDVQTLTCDQLANTYQEDANALANWYSGWYNGLAKKHYYHLTRVAGVEHELIVWCEAHPEKRIIEGLGFLAHEGRGPH
jgi:HdeA/HdeB family